jgi:hypothetical protein
MKHTLLILVVLALVGCASAPKLNNAKTSAIFSNPIDEVQKAAVDAIVVSGFNIKRQEPTYVEGARPRKIGLFVGSGGETIGVWLTSQTSDKTEVKVSTSKSLVGIVGQVDWSDQILAEIKKTLKK